MKKGSWAWRVAAPAVLVLGGCGGGGGSPVEADPAIAPFVGTWDAVEFTVTTVADPPEVADLLADGRFNVNVQPSGTYTATLVLGDLPPFVEIGTLSVIGDFVRFRPNAADPCPASSRYEFISPVRLTLSGPTCLDVNVDGEPDDADAYVELVLRG